MMNVLKNRSPVWWARWGRASELIAKIIPAHEKPILIISMPRSGSSWVGDIVGGAENALYLREPMNQSYLSSEGQATVFYVDPHSPPPNYATFAATAFIGLPSFPGKIARYATQWDLRSRSRKRVVIKEVNPLALPWLLDAYRPAVIFLIRHPAAVACSYWTLNWRAAEQRLTQLDPQLLEEYLHRWKGTISSASGYWQVHGTFQGLVTRVAIDCLAGYPDCQIVTYEDLCVNPEREFLELFEFSKLTLDSISERRISDYSTPTNQEQREAYSTQRYSADMALAWKRKIDQKSLDMLRAGYSAFELPYYNTTDDWTI
jgi:hypothetical protein